MEAVLVADDPTDVSKFARGYKRLADSFERNIVVMQAAWIEWQRGGGAEAAMAWIHNTLWGPGLLPEDGEATAQEYFDANAPEIGAAEGESD